MSVRPRQGQRPRPELGHRARPGNYPAVEDGVRAVEGQGRVVRDVADDAPRRPPVADLQNADPKDSRPARVGVRPGQGHQARPALGHTPRARNHAGVRLCRAELERQQPVVRNVAQRVHVKTALEPHLTRADRRPAGVDETPRQEQCRGSELGDAARPGDVAAVGNDARPIELQRRVVHDVPGEAPRPPAAADVQNPRTHRRPARVRVCPRQRQRPGASFRQADGACEYGADCCGGCIDLDLAAS